MAIETERKYICEMPDRGKLSGYCDFSESEITQIYLSAAEEKTHRVRARTKNGVTVYTETIKTRVSDLSCVEEEREIDRPTFETLAKKRDPALSVILKKRIAFSYLGQVFEVDIYPFYRDVCVVETELKSESERAVFPPELRVIREVTGDFRFSNAALAKEIPDLRAVLG